MILKAVNADIMFVAMSQLAVAVVKSYHAFAVKLNCTSVKVVTSYCMVVKFVTSGCVVG